MAVSLSGKLSRFLMLEHTFRLGGLRLNDETCKDFQRTLVRRGAHFPNVDFAVYQNCFRSARQNGNGDTKSTTDGTP